MGRLRILSALTVGLLFALGAITVVGGVAFGAVVRYEAEGMIETSDFISVQPDPDGTGPAGDHLRWAPGASVADTAATQPTTQPIEVPAGTTVSQLQVFTRQASGGNAEFAIYVDGTAAANRVGTFRPPAGSAWAISTVNLSTAIGPGTHTLFIGPNATFGNRVFIDWFELPSTATPQPSGFNPGFGKGSASECTTTISSGSIENAAKALPNGQVLCVRGGVYTEGDKRLNLSVSGTSSAPKKIKAYPGERVELRGAIIGTGSHWIIEGLFVDASYSPVMTTPGKDGPRTNTDQAIKWTGGTNLRFDSVELINRRSDLNPDLAGSCVFFGGTKPTNITIENSSIHQCGQLPRTNHEHCLYLGHSSGLTVRNNWVYDCADRSIKLDPDTDNALVVGNLVDSDHQAGITLDQSANNDTVQNNVVDTPNGKTIFTGNNYAGSGNAVIDNCVWATQVALAGNVTQRGNFLADPLISGHTVTNLSCAAKLPAGSPFRP
jgi:Right handed beta helix region